LEVTMTETDYQDRTVTSDRSGGGQHAAPGTMDALGSAASDTASAAKQQTREVAGEVKAQARGLASDAKNRMGAEVKGQNDRLADGLRHFADELDDMLGGRDDSPARSVVSQVSQGGRRVADYLSEHGPDGVLREVQDFARRRPGTFLAVAAAAGFVAGRLGKGVLGAGSADAPGAASGRQQPAPAVGSHAQPASVGYAPPAGDGDVPPATAGYAEPVTDGYVQPVADGYAGSVRPDAEQWDTRS
jgi:hypothetical protein